MSDRPRATPKFKEDDLLDEIVRRVTRLERHTPGVANPSGQFDPTRFGDIISADWDGNDKTTLDLSSADSTASQGYALDSDKGAAQFEGTIYARDFRILTTSSSRVVTGTLVEVTSTSGGSTPTSISTTESDLLSVTLSPPTWASTATIVANGGASFFGLGAPGVDDGLLWIDIDGDDGLANRARVDASYYYDGCGHALTFAASGNYTVALVSQQNTIDGIGIEVSSYFLNLAAFYS